MTDLRTEVAEALFNQHVFELAEMGQPLPVKHQDYYLMRADQFIALINKRWADWIEACGLEMVKQFNQDQTDFCNGLVPTEDADWGNEYHDHIPVSDDPNRFSPMSKP